MKLIGVLGGTFDPIHFGHLRMAQELYDALGLNEVRFIPAANPPHRHQPVANAGQRAEMVALAIAGNPMFKLDIRELERGDTSYTIDTLQSLRGEVGKDASICLLLGSDAFCKFDTWHRWDEILDLSHIALVERPMTNTRDPLPPILQSLLQDHYTENAEDFASSSAGLITMQRITALDISATRIREELKQGASPRYLLPDAVIDYLHAHRLYV